MYDNRPFNDNSYEQFLKEEKLMDSRCMKCGALALPPRPICVSCFSSEMEWFQFKGAGKLAAFTSIIVAPPFMAKEGFNKNNPYVVGVVELEGGDLEEPQKVLSLLSRKHWRSSQWERDL